MIVMIRSCFWLVLKELGLDCLKIHWFLNGVLPTKHLIGIRDPLSKLSISVTKAKGRKFVSSLEWGKVKHPGGSYHKL